MTNATQYCTAIDGFWPLSKEAGYHKSSIKSPGGLINFGHSRGGHIREGGLIQKVRLRGNTL